MCLSGRWVRVGGKYQQLMHSKQHKATKNALRLSSSHGQTARYICCMQATLIRGQAALSRSQAMGKDDIASQEHQQDNNRDIQVAPWHLTGYFTKQKSRQLDALGDIIHSPDQVSEPLSWTPDAKLRLAIQIVCKETGCQEDTLNKNVTLLKSLLPDLDYIKAGDLVRLSANVNDVAVKLIVIKDALPFSNASKIVCGHPRLLYLDLEKLKESLNQVKAVLGAFAPMHQWQLVLETAPFLLEYSQLMATLSEVERLFGKPSGGGVAMLMSSPELALSIQGLQGIEGNNTD